MFANLIIKKYRKYNSYAEKNIIIRFIRKWVAY